MITKILETLKPVATSLEFLLSYYILDVNILFSLWQLLYTEYS